MNLQTTIETLRQEALFGRLNRRQMLIRATQLGLSAPIIAGLLAACGGDDDEEPTAAEGQAAATDTTAAGEPTNTTEAAAPTDAAESDEPTATEETASESSETPTAGETSGTGRGAGGTLRILNWQAPTNLNPHFSQGYHNSAPASMVLEPLLSIDAVGDFHPVLIEEVPTLENGGISSDGTTITYTLKEGLVWSDGEPLTSEDARFTWEWVNDPELSPTSIIAFEQIENVEVVDERTFIVTFTEPSPVWYLAFSRGGGLGGQILPKHLVEGFSGAQADDAPFNLMPIGTGPYKIVEFKPSDVVIYEINELYREPDKPYFTTIEFKGGGDATSAARAVLQTGDADYAPNLQVESVILDQLMEGGAGELVVTFSGSCEQILINFADPNTEVDGARSEPTTEHPFLTELAVRQALALASDRETIATELYGTAGVATANVVAAPEKFVSPNTSFEFNIDQAATLLDEAEWVVDGDVRTKNGVEMRVLYQTTTNTLRQKEQEIIKQGWEQLGIATELKAIDSAVFFSSDAGNPDTWSHFYADVEMATLTTDPFPGRHVQRWSSVNPDEDIAQKSNDWLGRNLNRWRNEEYNELYLQVINELDPDKQAELFIQLNDIVVNEVVTIVLVHRAGVAGISSRLKGVTPTPWEQFTYDIANWYFEE